MLGPTGITLGLATVIIGHATFCIVVVYNNVLARLRRTGTSLEEASADLGADTFQTFRMVTLPTVRSALFAGGLLAFALSFDEIIVTTFTASPGVQTLPIWIFGNLFRPNQAPVVNVVAAALIVLSFVPVWLVAGSAGARAPAAGSKRPGAGCSPAPCRCSANEAAMARIRRLRRTSGRGRADRSAAPGGGMDGGAQRRPGGRFLLAGRPQRGATEAGGAGQPEPLAHRGRVGEPDRVGDPAGPVAERAAPAARRRAAPARGSRAARARACGAGDRGRVRGRPSPGRTAAGPARPCPG